MARATAAAAIHGSSVMRERRQQPADEPGRLGGPGHLDHVLDVAEPVGLAVAHARGDAAGNGGRPVTRRLGWLRHDDRSPDMGIRQ